MQKLSDAFQTGARAVPGGGEDGPLGSAALLRGPSGYGFWRRHSSLFWVTDPHLHQERKRQGCSLYDAFGKVPT